MSAVACPFKPVAQREVVLTVTEETPHEHSFLAQISLGEGLWVMDCSCGLRQRARKGARGEVVKVFDDGMAVGGTSLENCIFLKNAEGQFVDRWQHAIESTH